MATIPLAAYLYGIAPDNRKLFVLEKDEALPIYADLKFTHLVYAVRMDDEDEVEYQSSKYPSPDDTVVDVFGNKIGLTYVAALC